LILVVKLKRTVGDLRVHGGTEENRVVTNGMLLGLRDEREEAILILRGGIDFCFNFFICYCTAVYVL